MIYITHIRLSHAPFSRHEHITEVRWQNPADGSVGTSTVAQIVDWLRNGNEAKVSNGNRTVDVRVVDARPPYIRTYADRVWNDNLLALPHF